MDHVPVGKENPGRGAVRPSRRGFLNGFLGAVSTALGAAVVYPVIRFLSPPHVPEAVTNQVLAGKVSELAQTKWKIFPFGSKPGLLIQTSPGEYRAYDGTCTHLSCTVQYEDESQRIWCACHNGWYDLTGKNIAGPPPRPLETYDVEVVGDDIFVMRS